MDDLKEPHERGDLGVPEEEHEEDPDRQYEKHMEQMMENRMERGL